MRKILIADSGAETAPELEALLHDRCELMTCTDGETALNLLQIFRPDIFVVDLLLAKADGLSVLEQLRRWEQTPRILVQTGLYNPYILERLQRLNVDYVLLRPCPAEAVAARIDDFLAELETVVPQVPLAESFLGSILISLNFSPKLTGYLYLLDAIPLYAQDPSQSITKELYAAVANLRQKDAVLVERSIRSAIDKAFHEGDANQWARYFRCGVDGRISRPSNGAFIARMAQLLSAQIHRSTFPQEAIWF